MQTFLPFGPDFAATTAVLDRSRLLKQRVETLQIMNALAGKSAGWQRHPAVLMWRGHEAVLLDYQRAICAEVARRGYADTCLIKTEAAADELAEPGRTQPAWLSDRRLAATHQASLFRKDPEHYRQFAAAELQYRQLLCHPECNYWWPSHDESIRQELAVIDGREQTVRRTQL